MAEVAMRASEAMDQRMMDGGLEESGGSLKHVGSDLQTLLGIAWIRGVGNIPFMLMRTSFWCTWLVDDLHERVSIFLLARRRLIGLHGMAIVTALKS